MVDSDSEIPRLRTEVDRLSDQIDSLERKLAGLTPENLAQMQVHLAVLDNSLVNLKTYIDHKTHYTETDIARLEKDKLSKAEAKIPHLVIYALCAMALAAVVWAIFERIGLHVP